jgi:polar amino acid transport system permease protein
VRASFKSENEKRFLENHGLNEKRAAQLEKLKGEKLTALDASNYPALVCVTGDAENQELLFRMDSYDRDGGFGVWLSRFNPLAFLATAYVEILRSTPVIVQIFIIYHGVFGALFDLPSFTLFGFIKFDRFFPGVVALGMNSGAYLCEIIRSGIQSIDGGQSEASRSLGLSATQTMRFIILPQAIRNILPAIANEFVVIIKESAIAYTIGVPDLMAAVNDVRGAASIIMEPLLVATAVYFCLCFPTSKIIAYFERRMSRGDKR